MDRNFLYISKSPSAVVNLAYDEWFIDNIGDDDLVLYLYVNENAVIIGKNQNPWKECNLDNLKRDKAELVRRITGGGAVYHDSGNLNFSFIAGKNRYDKDKNFDLIIKTLASFGVKAELSGRNDIEVAGKKVSGNAFCRRLDNFQHHGTLLISSELSKLANYLNVDERKIKSKGISSVRARVINLCEINPDLSVEKLKNAIPENFGKVFGEYEVFDFDDETLKILAGYEKKHASWEWQMGETPKFDFEFDERLSFGGVQILFSLEKSIIKKISVYSDANDAELPEKIKNALCEIKFDKEEIYKALQNAGDEKLCEISEILKNKI